MTAEEVKKKREGRNTITSDYVRQARETREKRQEFVNKMSNISKKYDENVASGRYKLVDNITADPIKNNAMQGLNANKIANEEFNKPQTDYIGGISEGIIGGINKTIAGTGRTALRAYDMVSDSIKQGDTSDNLITKFNPIRLLARGATVFTDPIRQSAEGVQQGINQNADYRIAQADEKAKDSTSKFIINDVVGTGSNLIGKALQAPLTGGASFYTADFGNEYDKSIQQGFTPEQATQKAGVKSAITGTLDKIGAKGLGTLLQTGGKTALKTAITNGLKAYGIESATELAQNEADILIDRAYGLKRDDMSWEDVGKTLLTAGIITGGAKGVGLARQGVDYAKGKINQSIDDIGSTASEFKTVEDGTTDLNYNKLDAIAKYKKQFGDEFNQTTPETVQPTLPKLGSKDIGKQPKVDLNTVREATDKVKQNIPSLATQKEYQGTGEMLKTTNEMLKENDGKITLKLPDKRVKSETTFDEISPEIEKRYSAGQKVKKDSVITKAKDWLVDTKNMFSRQFKYLENNRENAVVNNELTKLGKATDNAVSSTFRTIDDITKGMNEEEFNLFNRKVFVDDLLYDDSQGKPLPQGFTSETLNQASNLVNSKLNDKVVGAIRKRNDYWKTIRNDYIQVNKELGNDIKNFENDNYFRHLVIEKMQENENKVKGTGQRLGVKQRGFNQTRQGTEKDIITNYFKAEGEVMAQIKADTLALQHERNILNDKDITVKLKAEAKTQNVDYKTLIPEGYTTFQPREGNKMFKAETINLDDNAIDLIKNGMKDFDVDNQTAAKIKELLNAKEVLALGKKRKEYIIPEEVAKTLENVTIPKDRNSFEQLGKKITTAWKKWTLGVNPDTVIKYNVRNFVGDVDAIIAGRFGTVKKVPQSFNEVMSAKVNGTFTKNLKDFIDMGGDTLNIYAQEIGNLGDAKQFAKLQGKKTFPNPIKGYLDTTKSLSTTRELTFRYAAYLKFKEEMQANNGMPKDFAMSKPEVIQGLKTIEDRAFKMSNDMLGNYDQISEGGRYLRENFIPFWSFTEANAKRYTQLMKNAWSNDKVAEQVGNSLLKKIGKTAYATASNSARLGVVGIKMYALTAVLSAFNSLFPDEEDSLPDDIKGKPHIILGKDEQGNVKYFSRLGSFNEFMEWFGLDTAQQDIVDIVNGNKSFDEWVKDNYDIGGTPFKPVVNKVANSLNPFAKTTVETMTGKKFYPDVTKPSSIRDTGEYVAQNYGLGDEYRAITGMPSKPLDKVIENIYTYSSDPKESAYYKIKDLTVKYNESLGLGSGQGTPSAKSNALYYYKKALKLNDVKAQEKYLKLYEQAGGTMKGLKQSEEALDPLSSLSQKNEKGFENSLTTKEKQYLSLAKQYYNETIQNKSKTLPSLPLKKK